MTQAQQVHGLLTRMTGTAQANLQHDNTLPWVVFKLEKHHAHMCLVSARVALLCCVPSRPLHLHLLHARTHAHAYSHTSRSKHCFAPLCSQLMPDDAHRTWLPMATCLFAMQPPGLDRCPNAHLQATAATPIPIRWTCSTPHRAQLHVLSSNPTPPVLSCSAATRLGGYIHFCPPVKHVCTLQRCKGLSSEIVTRGVMLSYRKD